MFLSVCSEINRKVISCSGGEGSLSVIITREKGIGIKKALSLSDYWVCVRVWLTGLLITGLGSIWFNVPAQPCHLKSHRE